MKQIDTPWKANGSMIVGGDNGRAIAVMTDPSGRLVGLRDPDWSQAMANAATIVRAVNNHTALFNACQDARACLLNLMPDRGPMHRQMQSMVGKLSAALEKAE